jgi:glycosyltransferase involved in cell wall biosynthesis
LGEKIRIIPRQESQQDVYQVMSQADCGVFPARAEGWNLEALEMLACGKQVIATNYSGHTEFLNEENSLLVDISELEDAQDGIWFKGQGQWAKIGDEQIDQIAEHMKSIHKLKQSDELNINQAGIDTSKEFSWDATVQKIMKAASDE